MIDLFKSEFRRFLWAGVAAAIVHLGALLFAAQLIDLAQQPLGVYRGMAVAYAVLGLLLATWQWGVYHQPGRWLNLLHRPLPPWRIALAVGGASLLWLLLVVCLPLLVMALWQWQMTARVVEARHLWLVLSAWLIASRAFVIAAIAMLAPRRLAWVALVLLLLPVMLQMQGPVPAFQAGMLLLAVLVWLSIFEPDLLSLPRSAERTVIIALPLQLGLSKAMALMLGFCIEMAWIVLGMSPLNTPPPPPGGAIEAERATPEELMNAGLATSTSPDAALWREQLPLTRVRELDFGGPASPTRGELAPTPPLVFDDREGRTTWVFSQARMQFAGYDPRAPRTDKGVLGLGNDDAPFPVPVVPIGPFELLPPGDQLLAGGNTFYRYDSYARRVLPWMTLPSGEIVAGPPQRIGEVVYVSSNLALYAIDAADVLRPRSDGPLRPRQRMALPAPIGSLSRIDVLPLVDGALVSTTYTRGSVVGQVLPFQEIQRLHGDGHVETVARRELGADYPASFRWLGWWMSPGASVLTQRISATLAGPQPLRALAPPPVPGEIVELALAVQLLAAVFAALWLRRCAMARWERLVWLLDVLCLGLPALVCLCLMRPRQAGKLRIAGNSMAPVAR